MAGGRWRLVGVECALIGACVVGRGSMCTFHEPNAESGAARSGWWVVVLVVYRSTVGDGTASY